MKWLTLMLLLSVTTASAVDIVPYTTVTNLSVNWTRTWSATDTTAGSKFLDTLYSPWVLVPAAKTYPLTAYVDGKHAYELGAIDTLMAGDTTFVKVQTINTSLEYATAGKTDATMMTTTALGTILLASADFDTLVSYVPTIARDTVFLQARYMRAMFVVIDSTEVGAPARIGKTYGRKLTLFVNAKP